MDDTWTPVRGFVPSLVAGVWVGYDDKRVIGPA